MTLSDDFESQEVIVCKKKKKVFKAYGFKMICSRSKDLIRCYICVCSSEGLFITLTVGISTALSAHHDSLYNLPTLLSNCLLLLPPSQTPADSQIQSTWSLCRRRLRWPWPSTRECSTRINLNDSGGCSCASPHCAPFPPTSSRSSSSCAWSERHPLRRWSVTCSSPEAPSAGRMSRDSRPPGGRGLRLVWVTTRTNGKPPDSSLSICVVMKLHRQLAPHKLYTVTALPPVMKRALCLHTGPPQWKGAGARTSLSYWPPAGSGVRSEARDWLFTLGSDMVATHVTSHIPLRQKSPQFHVEGGSSLLQICREDKNCPTNGSQLNSFCSPHWAYFFSQRTAGRIQYLADGGSKWSVEELQVVLCRTESKDTAS